MVSGLKVGPRFHPRGKNRLGKRIDDVRRIFGDNYALTQQIVGAAAAWVALRAAPLFQCEPSSNEPSKPEDGLDQEDDGAQSEYRTEVW